MTRDQDIERVLDRWFAEGPTQMPDRFLADTFDRIDRAPQPRLARLRTRLPVMNVTVRLAAIAAAIVIAVGVGFVIPRLPSAATAVPTAAPTTVPTAAPTEAVTPLVDPSMLIAKWISIGDRAFPGAPADPLAALSIDATTLSMNGWKGPIDSSWSLAGPDRHLVVTMRTTQADLTMQHFDCRPGQEGSYTVGLSADGGTMTLTPIRDDCQGRSDVMTGGWTRTGPGAIAPGRQVSVPFRPFGGGTTGQFSYTVPTGWVVTEGPGDLDLWLPGASDGAAIRLRSNVAPMPNSLEAGCGVTPADVQGTPAAIGAWLATQPGLVATTPTPVAIGGLTGVMVDLAVNLASPGCPALFRDRMDNPTVRSVPGPIVETVLDGEGRARYLLLDRGDGQILLIAIEAPNKATWDAAIADAMPIVQTFEFTR